MTKYTQKELEKEWQRRNKEYKEKLLKSIDIYKLNDGTYTDVYPSTNNVPDIRWFILVGILGGLIWTLLL